ncbi:YdeI/OmpD-associated family protein [Pelomonas sp. SE-A7]|uniref:YdeI/OmpD-associated family protein n=1 Tax=Pelomonas sp. SE-A7 TaxID=3054953 RepID=UPI00259D20D3|nr:YdeI/OmpD-associated family protein [Pelomonas sp. SE-A7]MDM4765863.1 YdeI/OmpD-associated family protein [Pelomonas sp. SE-A7]
MAEPIFFPSPAAWRDWLAEHADQATEVTVGFVKRGTGRSGLSWPESVDEALCVGWIDGVRHRIDEEHYKIRFTPRKPGSIWSAVNIARVEVLRNEGRMRLAGEAAFARRIERRSRVYAFEQEEHGDFTAAELRQFRRDKPAWAFFEKLPPSHRQRMLWWLSSAKQAKTRERRFAKLVEACAQRRRL